jgi:hypothetical protein
MGAQFTIRKALTAMLALTILLWAEAGLALLTGDRVIQCRAMPMMHSHVQAAADADDSDAMPCCPADSGQAPQLAASHSQCCSTSEVPERPLGFVVNSDRVTSHAVGADAEVVASFAPPPAQEFEELRSPGAPNFVKPVLDLKSDLRI